ncbi:MAG: WYL domain-containing protein [Muribaculaceae bacterium]|nr:WYL domain-containing protein [Muribaculaceae bacterium]
MVHDEFSDFHYRLRITDDFVSELLSYGSRIRVISPPELKARLCSEYEQALSQYDSPS